MVAAGFPPQDAILSAIGEAAKLLGATADIGTIEVGRYADIVAITGDPLADITLLQRIEFMMKGGEILKLGGRMLR